MCQILFHLLAPASVVEWSTSDLIGPEEEDWRVPVSELEARQTILSHSLSAAGMSAALIQNPVDLHYYAGGRQNAALLVPAEGEAAGTVQFVRRSLRRAEWDAGGDDAPHEVAAFPRLSAFSDELARRGVSSKPSLQLGSIPHSYATRFIRALDGLDGDAEDCSRLVHSQREAKSEWEIGCMREGAEIQLQMFETIAALGAEGVSELELAASAEAVSRAAGFGGDISLRRFPMQCDRGVVVAGRAEGIPSFFDAAIGGTGPHPGVGMGSGFGRIKAGEPVLVDLLHAHRGYIVDMTRMFVAGSLSEEWMNRLEDMLCIKDVVVDVLDQGRACSEAWKEGFALACELGYEDHLMGMRPDQARFLAHAVGLELDESPVVSEGFDMPLKIGATMAIEPKVVYPEGSIGSEDTWVRTEDGMEPLTAGAAFPWVHEWE